MTFAAARWPFTASFAVFALILALEAGVPRIAGAQQCLDYRPTTHWTGRVPRVDGSRPWDVVGRTPYAYAMYSELGRGVPEFAVIDAREPQRPAVAGSVIVGRHGRVALSWPYVFVTDPDLAVVDVSNPRQPLVVSETDLPGTYARAIAVAGHVAWVVTDGNTIRAMDVSDVTAPVEIASIPVVGSSRDLLVSDGRLYSSEWRSGVRIHDVSDPAAPVFLGTIPVPAGAEAVALRGNVAHVAAGGSGLLLFDVSNPAAPVPLGSVPNPWNFGGALDVALHGALAYVPGQFIADESDPSAPTLLTPWSIAANATLDVSGGLAFQAHQYLHVFRLLEPTPAASFDLPLPDLSSVAELTLDGTRGYLTMDPFGSGSDLLILDLSNPGSPTVVADVPGNGSLHAVRGQGEWAFTLTAGLGPEILQTVDMSDPANPRFVGSVETAPFFRSDAFALSENADYAYLLNSLGLMVVDLRDRAAPAVVATFPLPGAIYLAMDVGGSHVYALQHQTSLDVIDVSDPTAPQYVTSLPANGTYGVKVDGKRVYYGSMWIADISHPAQPQVLSQREMSADVVAYAPHGDTVYCLTSTYGVQVMDVSDPTHPRAVGMVSHPSRPSSIVAGTDRVWITVPGGSTNPPGGLYSLPRHCPERAPAAAPRAARLPAAGHPNPARGDVGLSFVLPRSGPARVEVHDVQGRRVWERSWHAAAGRQEIRWDGRDRTGNPAGAGIYFFVARGEGGSEVRGKITLIR